MIRRLVRVGFRLVRVAYLRACPADRPGRLPAVADSNEIVELRGELSPDGRRSTIVGVAASGRVVYATTLAVSRDAAA